MPRPQRSRTRTWNLSATRTGETVRIQRILFDTVRSHCEDRGLREGDVVSCRSVGPDRVALEGSDGCDITLEREWTRFIQVSPLRALSIQVGRPAQSEAA